MWIVVYPRRIGETSTRRPRKVRRRRTSPAMRGGSGRIGRRIMARHGMWWLCQVRGGTKRYTNTAGGSQRSQGRDGIQLLLIVSRNGNGRGRRPVRRTVVHRTHPWSRAGAIRVVGGRSAAPHVVFLFSGTDSERLAGVSEWPVTNVPSCRLLRFCCGRRRADFPILPVLFSSFS